MLRLLIPDSLSWPLPDLPLEPVRFSVREPLTSQQLEAEAAVVWGLPRAALAQLERMPNLRWVQALTAGIDHVLALDLPEGVTVCNGKGLHDAPTAEIAVALLLSATRRLHHFRDLQHAKSWDKTAYRVALEREGGGLYTLEGARVLIAGFGAIGLEIARRLTPFGAQVEGLATRAGEREGFRVHALEAVQEVLPQVDALVLVLPDTPQTQGFLSRERLALLPRHAWVVNVGRGTAIDEVALIEALEGGQIAGAALDVYATEPLPENSRLWTLENAILSPHVGGGGPNFYRKAADLLRRNAERFVRGEPLENVVERSRGY